ncbi:hypothetical protein GQ600_3863 [Phytophthora cactorum]|nr:hypothetical protein GQ600_3863 [Phytophthora cactorum]
MGPCASRRRMHAEDRAQEKIAEFVRYAISSDLDKLREMITKRKMNLTRRMFACSESCLGAEYLITIAIAVRGKSIKVVEMLLKLGADPNLRNEVSFSSNASNRVTSAKLPTHIEIRNEATNPELRPPDFIGLALQPIRRGSHTTERTEVRSFMSRRSITECTDHTARRNSMSEEPSKWATSTLSKPAALYVSSPDPKKEHASLQKDLHYAGERVIMAIRVKGCLV